MGSSQSSNVSKAVTNLSNYVSNSTTVNSNQVNSVESSININNCTIDLAGDFNLRNRANLIQTNTQIATSLQDANLTNNIQQQMLQESTSKVGFIGIGFADASNSANSLVQATSKITNDVSQSANQYNNTSNTFDCNRSVIQGKNLNISFNSDSQFLSSQTLGNTQTSRIVNDISQTIDQKATAIVEGIGGFLIALLLILAVIIYAVGKPLDSGAGKIAVSMGLVVLLALVITGMFLRNTPPLFAKKSECIKHSAIGLGSGANISECIDMKPNEQIMLEIPPTKYIYPILPGDSSTSGGNLVQMAISRISGQNKSGAGANGGYKADTYINLETRIKKYAQYASLLGIENIPNPLKLPNTEDTDKPYYAIPEEYMPNLGDSGNGSKCTPGTVSVGIISDPSDFNICTQPNNPQNYPYGRPFKPTAFSKTTNPYLGVANINLDVWKNYLAIDNDNVKALFARFVLCDIIGTIELHYYVKNNELIKFVDDKNRIIIGFPSEYPKDTYFFKPNTSINNWASELSGNGYIEGYVGELDNRQHRFDSFVQNIGIWIMLGMILLTFLYMCIPKTDDSQAPKKPSLIQQFLSGEKKVSVHVENIPKT